MAIKHLIALCLIFAISVHADAEAEAEAESDAYYGYYNRGNSYYGHSRRFYGGHQPYRSTYINSYKHPFNNKKPVPYKTYGYKLLNKPVPASTGLIKPVETPVVNAAQAEPPVKKEPISPYADESILKAFNVVPAVPEDHLEHHVESAPLLESDNTIENAVEPVFKNTLASLMKQVKAEGGPPVPVPAQQRVPEQRVPEQQRVPFQPVRPVQQPQQRRLPLQPVRPVQPQQRVPEQRVPLQPVRPVQPVAYDESPAVDVIAAAPEKVVPSSVAQALPDLMVPQVAPSLNNLRASQYHAQDEFGNVIYGYNHPNSAKKEQRDSFGNVVGSYSYNDGTGYPKHVSYVADRFGFRVTGANNFVVHHHRV